TCRRVGIRGFTSVTSGALAVAAASRVAQKTFLSRGGFGVRPAVAVGPLFGAVPAPGAGRGALARHRGPGAAAALGRRAVPLGPAAAGRPRPRPVPARAPALQ